LAAHVERNIERINNFIENNKKLEKCLFTAVNERDQSRRGNSSAKKKMREARSSAGSLNQSQTSSHTGRIKSARAYDARKMSYTPIKGDNVDQKLSDYINGHDEFRRLSHLFRRTSPGEYQYGNRKISIKLDNEKLYGNEY